MAELANVAGKERALLDQCKDLLSIIAAMQVFLCLVFLFQSILKHKSMIAHAIFLLNEKYLYGQVKQCSLRTHFIQLKRVPSSLTTKV